MKKLLYSLFFAFVALNIQAQSLAIGSDLPMKEVKMKDVSGK